MTLLKTILTGGLEWACTDGQKLPKIRFLPKVQNFRLTVVKKTLVFKIKFLYSHAYAKLSED
jgi:hypothetical protein